MISHHPPPDVLADSARGVLDYGAMLVVAAHVHACAVCRAEVKLWEGVGGALLEEEAPQPLSDGAFERMSARLNSTVTAPSHKNALPKYLEAFSIPEPLRTQSFGSRFWVTPNIWFASVEKPAGSESRTYLLYAKPNTKLSVHTHVGREMTIILHGAFRDGSDLYAASDFAMVDDAVTHSPAVTGDQDCLCLISADAPMRLSNPIARAIQVLTGRFY
jgi:putative transcriptional regulator